MGITPQADYQEIRKLYRLGVVGASTQVVVGNVLSVLTMYLLISWTSGPINLLLHTGLYLISNIAYIASILLISGGFQAMYRESSNRLAYHAALGYLAMALFSVAGLVSQSISSFFVSSLSGIITSTLAAMVLWSERNNANHKQLYIATCIVFLLCAASNVFAFLRNIEFILYQTIYTSNPLFIPNFIACGIIRPILLFAIFFRRISQLP